MSNTNEQFLDLYRSAVTASAETLRTCIEGAERLRIQQLSAIREAIEENRRCLNEMAGSGNVNELVAQQIKLAGSQIERTVNYWSGFYLAAGENQAEVTKQLRDSATQLRESMQQALGSASFVAEPVRQAMQDIVNSAFASTARVTEEAAKTTAAQVETATAGIRQSIARQERKSA
jgi:phasin family protein